MLTYPTPNVGLLTGQSAHTLWFAPPDHSQEEDGDPGEDDDDAYPTHHRLRDEAEDQQKGPEDQVCHRDQEVYLGCKWSNKGLGTLLHTGGARYPLHLGTETCASPSPAHWDLGSKLEGVSGQGGCFGPVRCVAFRPPLIQQDLSLSSLGAPGSLGHLHQCHP